MSDPKRPMTALEYYARGIARNDWNKRFDLDSTPCSPAAPDPQDERDAAELRRIIARERREALEYQAELDRLSAERADERRRLMEACTPAWADEAPAPRASEPVNPTSPEAAAREATMDRLLAKTWPGRRD
jgi:hypothetical protein